MWNLMWLDIDSSLHTNDLKWLDSFCDSTLTRIDQVMTLTLSRLEKILDDSTLTRKAYYSDSTLIRKKWLGHITATWMCMGKYGLFKIRRGLSITQNNVETCGTFNIVAIPYNSNSPALVCDWHICSFCRTIAQAKIPSGWWCGFIGNSYYKRYAINWRMLMLQWS